MKHLKFTLIELIICIVIFVGCGTVKKVEEVGAKQVLEEVWEGPESATESATETETETETVEGKE